MKASLRRRRPGCWLAMGILALAAVKSHAGAPRAANCRKIVLLGEVSAGQEWKASIGQGWVFRLMPIQPANSGYSGWDLVADRDQPAGFPDALLVATPPYNSINEREVGTTFQLRAQDAIGWNPRSFHFLTNPAAFREVQGLYLSLSRGGQVRLDQAAQVSQNPGKSLNADDARATRRLMELVRDSSAGQFRILDAHLKPGVADAASYAETWAIQSMKTPQTYDSAPGAKSTPLGELHWLRFSITLWLPGAWKAPAGVHATMGACLE